MSNTVLPSASAFASSSSAPAAAKAAATAAAMPPLMQPPPPPQPLGPPRLPEDPAPPPPRSNAVRCFAALFYDSITVTLVHIVAATFPESAVVTLAFLYLTAVILPFGAGLTWLGANVLRQPFDVGFSAIDRALTRATGALALWSGVAALLSGVRVFHSACVSGGEVARRWHALGPRAVAEEARAAVTAWWAGVRRGPAWWALLGGSVLLALGWIGVSLAPQVWFPPEGESPSGRLMTLSVALGGAPLFLSGVAILTYFGITVGLGMLDDHRQPPREQ